MKRKPRKTDKCKNGDTLADLEKKLRLTLSDYNSLREAALEMDINRRAFQRLIDNVRKRRDNILIRVALWEKEKGWVK